jgi:hypothetical protein
MTKARDTANLTGSGVTLPLLDIDAGTDIGAALVDADLMIVDDGAGGTNRKATMSRLATYMGTKIGGGMEFLASSGAISNAANVSFTQFDSSKYDAYDFFFFDVLPATDGAEMRALTSSDTSSHSYDSGTSDYQKTISESPTGAFGQLIATDALSDTTNEGTNITVRVNNPHTSQHTIVTTYNGVVFSSSDSLGESVYRFRNAGFIRKEAAQVNAIQFYFSSGNIASGEITMFGIVNS